ncbi:hypothetical protein ACG2F4_15065 [Halalkalibaculum sp. DA3122]|uniref:hypothetical protein n=1 Tax=Halalkalibaculum sp. DA3122 TaxID=3373607 RepID=UPI003753FB50
MKIKQIDNKSIDSSRYELRVLGQEWNERLLRLTSQSPVKAGRFQIHFDRSPDIFAIPRLTSYNYRCLGLFRNDELLGYVFASYQKRYINQRVTDVIYLGNMHVFQHGLGREFLKLLSDRLSGIISKNRQIKFIYAYIMDRNIPAMKLSEHGFFSPRVVGQISMVNILLLFPKQLSRTYTVRRAQPADINAIVELLKEEHTNKFLAPEMNGDLFLQNLTQRPLFGIENYFLALLGNEIVGVCSAWDMTALKKNRILKYGLRMELSRMLYNLAASIAGAARLPNTGEALRDITIAEYAVMDRDPAIMEALLRYVYNTFRQDGYHSMIFGGGANEPLLGATKPFIAREVRSNVVLGTLHKTHPEIKNTGLIYADAIQI